jgi:hypothetical protein
MKYCVFVRCVNEQALLSGFIEHYVNLGFDTIIVLYSNEESYSVPEIYKEYVKIHEVENWGNYTFHKYRKLITEEYDWVFIVDLDELLILNGKYLSIDHYVKEKLNENEKINVFQFSWMWIHKFNSHNEKITDMIPRYKKFVGFLKNKSFNVWVKSMVKVNQLHWIYCHGCRLKNKDNNQHIYVNKKVLKVKQPGEWSSGCSERKNFKIRNYPLCNETYEETILLHFNTISLRNAITKACNIHTSQVTDKKIKSKYELRKCLKKLGDSKEQEVSKERLKNIVKNVGYKL